MEDIFNPKLPSDNSPGSFQDEVNLLIDDTQQ